MLPSLEDSWFGNSQLFVIGPSKQFGDCPLWQPCCVPALDIQKCAQFHRVGKAENMSRALRALFQKFI